MCNISKNAVISAGSSIGKAVRIGDFTIVEDDTIIGEECNIGSSVMIHSGSRISDGCKIYKGAVIGAEPQDLKYKGEYTTAEIGKKTIIREFCTVSRGTSENKKTLVGSNCFLMSYVHIAHDSVIRDNVIISNSVQLGGHVKIDESAIIGGLVGIHQFVRIGCHSFIAFSSRVTQDVPPYILAGGSPINYKGLNLVGLKRRGFSEEAIKHIKQTYNYIYHSKYNISDAIKAIKDSVSQSAEVKDIINFIETSERGIIRK